MVGFERFSGELSEAIKSLSGGIELRALENKYDVDPRTMAAHDIVREHPEVVQQFEQLLDQWCRQIEQYLEQSLDKGETKDREPGPHTELEYWRSRMQRITSITEQLKSKDCKATRATGVLKNRIVLSY